MISVYGQRATMVSGLLAISIAFAHLDGKCLILWFTAIRAYFSQSPTFFYIRPHRYIELQIAQGILLTAKYLKWGDLWRLNSDPQGNYQ
jgi:hypothetical protein